jgi:hypothetical protein
MKKMPYFGLFYYLMICALVFTVGCLRNAVRLDLDTYLQTQASHEGQDIIITASLEDVLARYSLYKGKKIEVTAPVAWYKSYGFWTWHLLLVENRSSLRGYTHYYRIEPGWDAINLLARAIHGKRPVTVLGILTKDGIDIQRLTCDNESATTSFKPPQPTNGWWMPNW